MNGSLTCTGFECSLQGGGGGASINVPTRRTAHCAHFMPANDKKGGVFGHQFFPCLSR